MPGIWYIDKALMSLLDKPMVFTLLLFVLMVLVVEFGFRLAQRKNANAAQADHEQIVTAGDALRLLLSLLLGFTLAMALPRYDLRRQAVVDEANSIGTTYLRAQFLTEPARTRFIQTMKEYVDVRIHYSEVELQSPEFTDLVQRSGQLQQQPWQQAVAGGQKSPTVLNSILDASLNETIDLSEKRLSAVENRIPSSVWLLLLIISVLASFATGYSAPTRVWLALLSTPLMIAIVMGLIADMDSPRNGLIRTDLSSLRRVQQMIKSSPPPAEPEPVVDSKPKS